MEIICKFCNSENVYFSKKKQKYICEDCEESFVLEEEPIVPQKVFLSYGHDENAEIVEIIYEKLQERGHFPWIDKAEIKSGNDWRNKIMQGIVNSDDFLAFLSNYSVRVPGVCLDEISIGISNYNCRMKSVLLEKGVMPPNSISNIQWLDLSEWKEKKETSNKAVWDKWLDDMMLKIFDIVEDKKNIEISGNISKLDELLHPIDAGRKIRTLLKNRIVAREWLIDIIKSAKDEKALIICGTPGTGKSVLSAYLCNFATECIVAFFFEWNNADTKKKRKLIYSIIFQLACNLEDYQYQLMDLIKKYDIREMSDDELMEEMLLRPLHYLIDGGREHKFIILDAIDEAVNENEELLDVIIRFIEGMPSWIRIMITMKPEKMLLERLQSYKIIRIDDEKESMNNDVYEYIRGIVTEEEMAERMSKICGNSFLCAREMVRLYEEKKMDFDVLPAGIGGIYYEYFRRTFKEDTVYEKEYKPIFELLFAAKEQISINEISRLLGIGEEELQKRLALVSSYIVQIPQKGEIVLQVFHQSFQEWMISQQAGKYRILVKNGDKRYEEYLLQNTDSKNVFSKYLVDYAFAHISKVVWEELDILSQEKFLSKLLDGAIKYGFLYEEEKYLHMLQECSGKKYSYYMYAIEYYKKISGHQLLEISEDALKYAQFEEKEEQKQFDLTCQIAFAYFYCGYAQKAYQLIVGEREKHQADFWTKEENEATCWHVIAVSAHDLDINTMVQKAAKRDVELYTKNKRFYDQYISMINLFDAHMALGQLQEAEVIAKKVLEAMEYRYYIHVDDILKICYANLLQTQGRIMEALEYYESGLKIAKEIQTWDYLYGSIWRELAVAKFGDTSCLKGFIKYRQMALEDGYSYLVSLADCFYILSSYYLGEAISSDEMTFYEEIKEIGMPGHLLQAYIGLALKGAIQPDMKYLISLLEKCQGVKGSPELILKFLTQFGDFLSTEEKEGFTNWCKTYVNPIDEYQKGYFERLVENLPPTPVMGSYNCRNCQAKCCYDGVYLLDSEEEIITQVVEENPEYFEKLNHPYIVEGDWPGMRGNRKTQKAEYNLYDDTFPKHFTKTRCVFALETGECSLQRLATDTQMHPWKYKPRACWSFPIRGVKGTEILPPDVDRETDPDYVDENYPGYATYLPCAVVDEEKGQKWYEKYKYEVEYYNYLIREKKL